MSNASRSSAGYPAAGAVVLCGTSGAPPCPTTAMLEKVMTGLASVSDPRLVRERFEEDLRTIVRARSVRLRDDAAGEIAAPGVISCDLPGRPFDRGPRLEAVFDPARPIEPRARQMLAAGAHVAGLLIEIERAPALHKQKKAGGSAVRHSTQRDPETHSEHQRHEVREAEQAYPTKPALSLVLQQVLFRRCIGAGFPAAIHCG